MNSSVMAQRSNSRFFFISLSFAIGLAVASGFLVKGMFSGDTGGVDASTKSCLAVMRTNGFNPNITSNGISIALATTMNIESLVYKSGVIIAGCPAYTLQDYCAGAGCPNPGVTFTLIKKEL
ncbi:hypothetical protein [Burkholderia ubonensis]|uniref:hypothetical protein n=1 Tax=Burkholderia ubonensis TaxID=101571 RepID=UPI0018E04499|nr:hypothetical protein [Burkholderia ubonensis]